MRGEEHARRGKVLSSIVTEDSARTLILKGVVEGILPYQVQGTFDRSRGRFTKTRCTCATKAPCEHLAALVISYLQRTEGEKGSSDTNDADTQQRTARRHPLAERASDDRRSSGILVDRYADPEDLVLCLSRRVDGYVPSLHTKGNYYTALSPTTLAQQEGLRPELTRLLDHLAHDPTDEQCTGDVRALFTRAYQAGLPVLSLDHESMDVRPVSIDLDPKEIRVRLAHETVHEETRPGHERHEVRAVLEDERDPRHTVRRSIWSRFGPVLVQETDTALRLYDVGETWAELIVTATPYYRTLPGTREPEYLYHATLLSHETLASIPSLTRDIPSALDLTIDPTVQRLVVHESKGTPVLVVDADLTSYELSISPIRRYGPWQTEIGTAWSHRALRGRDTYERTRRFEHPETHVLVLVDQALHFVPFDRDAELAQYRALEAQRDLLDLSRTFTVHREGRSMVEEYLRDHYPRLYEFAISEGYALEFPRDVPPREQVALQATLTFHKKAAPLHDWLNFRTELACGGRPVPLEMLFAHAEQRGTYWHTDDGGLLELTNQTEVLRLAHILKHFRIGKDGLLEGRLYHAPELADVAQSSPHFIVENPATLEAIVTKIRSGKPDTKLRLPKRLATLLRPYQKEGVEWLSFLKAYGFGGLLADDMGLGKTLQTLVVLRSAREPGVPSLILCPKSLVHNWQQEAERFVPELRVLAYDGTRTERERMQHELTQHDVVVMSYHTFKQDADALCAAPFRYNYAVLDEAQHIKNHMTKLAQRVKAVPALHRLALTGTPLENHVLELWSMFDFLMPGFLGTEETFRATYHRPVMEQADARVLELLRAKIAPFMLRRTKTEVLSELPPKVEQTIECTLSDEQRALYETLLDDVQGTIERAIGERGFARSRIHILAGLTKLRQMCDHPALILSERDDPYPSTKLDACIELIEEVRQSERKVLIFSQFTGMLDLLADALTRAEIPYVELTGRTRKRSEVIERFTNDPNMTAFLISMKAGGTGLNLTAADTVIVFDPWWNPSVEHQAIDRAHRIGQTQSVHVYRLVTEGTVEEKMEALKQKKQRLFDALVTENGELGGALTWDDVRELFAP